MTTATVKLKRFTFPKPLGIPIPATHQREKGERVENSKAARIVREIVGKRIATLVEIIRAKEEGLAEIATMRLAQIGIQESSDALMSLIEQTEESELRNVMSNTLVDFSPLRNNYRDRLTAVYDKETTDALFAVVEHSAYLRTLQPLWQTIMEALGVTHAMTGSLDEIEEMCEGVPHQLK